MTKIESGIDDIYGCTCYFNSEGKGVTGSVAALIEKLGRSKSNEYRERIISILGWVQERDKLESVIGLVEEGKIKKQDTIVFYAWAAKNPRARDFLFSKANHMFEQMKKDFIGMGMQA